MHEPGPRFSERLNRILTAAALGTPDRVPVVTAATTFAAHYTGITPAAFCASPQAATEAMLGTLQKVGDVDGAQFALFNPHLLSLGGLSRVKVPGVELPGDAPFQVDEQELLSPEDYDVIAAKGWNTWLETYRFQRLDNLMAKVGPTFGYIPTAMKMYAQAGIPVLSPLIALTPYESFIGGRTLVKFMRDIFTQPDRVKAAADVAQAENIAMLKHMITATKPLAVFIGFGRSNRGMVSRRLQDKFVYPYAQELVEAVLEAGAIPLLHCDQDWSDDFEFLRGLPQGKCILQLDGSTDIFRAKAALGDRMCLMGDIPPTMMVLGRPDEVHAYSRRLIREIGPSGFILCQGCDLPPNARPENFEAMVAAATGH